MVKIVECPRDAMQGIMMHIPTETKVAYLNQLLRVGFDTLDFGSFVSPKAVPQMADTAEVLAGLDLGKTATRLLAIVVNMRGATAAAAHAPIHFLGYPFSISETFQLRNSRKTITESMDLARNMQQLCLDHGKELLVYISMGFGNPYGDPWSPQLAAEWVEKMAGIGVRYISLADTVGTADQATIGPMFQEMIPRFPEVAFSAHFHSKPENRKAKLQAAWDGGCRRFESAMMGFGGCPFAEDELVGNIATETLTEWLAEIGEKDGLDREAFGKAMLMAGQVFGMWH